MPPNILAAPLAVPGSCESVVPAEGTLKKEVGKGVHAIKSVPSQAVGSGDVAEVLRGVLE